MQMVLIIQHNLFNFILPKGVHTPGKRAIFSLLKPTAISDSYHPLHELVRNPAGTSCKGGCDVTSSFSWVLSFSSCVILLTLAWDLLFTLLLFCSSNLSNTQCYHVIFCFHSLQWFKSSAQCAVSTWEVMASPLSLPALLTCFLTSAPHNPATSGH
jgi:hypothetical protein